MRSILTFTVSTLLGLIAVPAAADFGPSDSAATPRHFSIHYNILRSSFEARFLPSDRWYLAFVPSIVGVGSKDSYSEGAFFPIIAIDQAYSAYGYAGLLELNPATQVAMRAGLEIQDVLHMSDFFYFAEAGLRIRIVPYPRWAFELSAYPMQVSYHTYRDWRRIVLFQGSNMNLGLEFLF